MFNSSSKKTNEQEIKYIPYCCLVIKISFTFSNDLHGNKYLDHF